MSGIYRRQLSCSRWLRQSGRHPAVASNRCVHKPVDILCRHADGTVRKLRIRVGTRQEDDRRRACHLHLCRPRPVRGKNFPAFRLSTIPVKLSTVHGPGGASSARPAGRAGPTQNTVTGTGKGGSLNPVAGRPRTVGEAPAGGVPGADSRAGSRGRVPRGVPQGVFPRAGSLGRIRGPRGRQWACGRPCAASRSQRAETVTIMVRLPYCLDHVFDGGGAPGHDRQSHR